MDGLKILCIDGGGMRGTVPLTVLKSLKQQTDHKQPWESFDVIVGTSTGGVLAVLLGLLKIPLDECGRIYQELGEEVFEPGFFKKAGRFMFTQQQYSAERLKKVVRRILQERTGSADIKLSELQPGDGRVHVVLVANQDGYDVPYRFTNFSSNDNDGNTLTMDVTVWEAVRATSAAPTYFDRITIDIPDVGPCTFFDGGINYNNPIEVAKVLITQHPFRGNRVACYASLGTGMATFTLGNVDGIKATVNYAIKAATNSEIAHGQVWPQLGDMGIPYFRFNPEDGLGNLPMDSLEFLERMQRATGHYLQKEDVKQKMRRLLDLLRQQETKEVSEHEVAMLLR